MSENFIERFRGCWAVFEEGTNKYIGRVVKAQSTDEALAQWVEKGFVSISPALQYISRLVPQQTPQGAVLSRDSAVLPFDLCLEDESVVHIKPATIAFLDQMSPKDRIEYETLINRCGDIMLQSRMAKSGLTLSTQMPSNLPNMGSLIRK